jgi:hypothetical protein
MVPVTANLHGIPTTRYGVVLTADQFEAPVWQEIAIPTGRLSRDRTSLPVVSRDSISALVWIDSQGQIRRLSYEASYDQEADTVMWFITDFADFGASIDREPPTSRY